MKLPKVKIKERNEGYLLMVDFAMGIVIYAYNNDVQKCKIEDVEYFDFRNVKELLKDGGIDK